MEAGPRECSSQGCGWVAQATSNSQQMMQSGPFAAPQLNGMPGGMGHLEGAPMQGPGLPPPFHGGLPGGLPGMPPMNGGLNGLEAQAAYQAAYQVRDNVPDRFVAAAPVPGAGWACSVAPSSAVRSLYSVAMPVIPFLLQYPSMAGTVV